MSLVIDNEKILEKLKRRHSIIGNEQDLLLMDIIEDTIAHYLAIAGGLAGTLIDAVPAEHSFIITDVASKRYIRRGSEGLTIERVDQYQAQYEDPEKDFSEYFTFIDGVHGVHDDDRGKGRVVFY